MPTILVTGSNRGLGLEWVRQYARQGWEVIATCRDPDAALELRSLAAAHPHVYVEQLDVTDPRQIQAVAQAHAAEPLDLLVNNAGVYYEKFNADSLGDMRYSDWEQTFRVNTLGPVRMVEAFTDHLKAGVRRLVVTITSHMGSIADIETGGSYAYRSSKAALNAAMKGLAAELRCDDIGILLLHPGWVRTRMGGPGALITPETSVTGMRRLVEGFQSGDSARFLRYDGTALPW